MSEVGKIKITMENPMDSILENYESISSKSNTHSSDTKKNSMKIESFDVSSFNFNNRPTIIHEDFVNSINLGNKTLLSKEEIEKYYVLLNSGKNSLNQEEYLLYVKGYQYERNQELKSYQDLLKIVNEEIENKKEIRKACEDWKNSIEELQLSTENDTLNLINCYKEIASYDNQKENELLNEELKQYDLTIQDIESKTTEELIETFKSKNEEVKKRYEEIEKQKKLLESYTKQETGFQSYEAFHNYVLEMDESKILLESAIKTTHKMIANAEYSHLSLLEDYQSYVNKEEIVTSLEGYQNKDGVFYKNLTQIEALSRASEINPELGKVYNYLYETQGKEKANDYLKMMEETLNQINGQVNAEKFLSTLKDEKELMDYLENHLKVGGKGIYDGIGSFFEGIGDWVTGKDFYSESEYETMYILQALQGDSEKHYDWALQHNYNMTQSIGNMLPSIALSMLLTPVGGSVASTVGSMSMGISAGGKSYHNALVEGHDTARSVFYGVLNGVSEAALQKMVGGIVGLSEVEVVDLKSLAVSMLHEGIEEGSQEYLDALFKYGLWNEKQDFSELSKNAFVSAIYGSLTAGVMNGVGLGVNKVTSYDNPHIFGEIMEESQTVYEQVKIDSVNVNEEIEILEDIKSDVSLSNDAQILLDEWNKLSFNDEKIEFINNKINKLKTNELKIEFIDQVLMNEPNIANSIIANIIQDEILLHHLVGSGKIENLIEKNLLRIPKLLAPILNNLTLEEFNQTFNHPQVKEAIYAMSFLEFKNVLMIMGNNPNIFYNETFLNKIASLPQEEYFLLVDQMSYYISKAQKNLIRDNLSISSYDQFLENLLSEHYTEKYALGHPENVKWVEKLIADLENVEIYKTENVVHLRERIDLVKENLKEQIKNNSKLEFMQNSKNEYSLKVNQSGWYDVCLEVNGKLETFSIKAVEDFKNGPYCNLENILGKTELQIAFMNNQATIESIQFNERKTKLNLTNLKKGLNRFDIEINGKMQSFVFETSFMGAIDLSSKFDESQIIGDIKITPIESLNVKPPNQDGVYILKGSRNGQEVSYYIPIDRDGNLNVNEVLLENNLYDLENSIIEEVNLDNVDLSPFNIERYSESSTIFGEHNYGGDQSNAYDILIKDSLTQVESLKKASIQETVKKYFPNASDVEIASIARAYGSVGCSFMAFANSIATYFGSIENGALLFKDKFGYNLYFSENGNKSFNFETIALDCFLSYEQENTVRDTCSNAKGLTMLNRIDAYNQFLNPKGIEVKSNEQNSAYNYGDLITQLLNYGKSDNSFYILNATNFDLEYIKGDLPSMSLDNSVSETEFNSPNQTKVGGHAMLITDVSNNGDIFVSSWGQKYKVKKDFFSKYEHSSANICPITFHMKEGE